jgi:4-amino-4-deoxy-L-arabinose transferase-like glycosyltransferase
MTTPKKFHPLPTAHRRASFILHPSPLTALGLFGLALALRLIYAIQIPFPPLDDPAYYIQGARSLRTGHPLDLAITWNYYPTFNTVLRPGFDFWMPLTAFLIAASFSLFGDNMLASQLPGVLGGALLAPLTYYLARRAFAHLNLEQENRTSAILSSLAGLYIALNPLLAYQSAVPDSQMIYAPLVAAAVLVWIGGKSNLRALGFGLLLGLAYITRSHAVFLGLAWAGVMLWQLRKEGRPALIRALCTLAGLGLTAGPWILRTWLTFGFINSPAGLQSGLIYDYATLFNYETPINFSSFANLGLGRILEARVNALYNAWIDVLGVMFFPTVLLPLSGLIFLWRRNRILGIGLLYSLLLALGLPLIFVAASSTGSFYHSSGSMAAFGAIGYIYLLWLASNWYRGWRKSRVNVFPVLVGVVILLLVFQLSITINTTVEQHRHDQQVYSRLQAWLATQDTGPAVIADEPSTLNYATGLAALRLPSDEPLEVVQHLTNRYGARYIVITGNFGRYPALLRSPANTLFTQVYLDPKEEFEVYEVRK